MAPLELLKQKLRRVAIIRRDGGLKGARKYLRYLFRRGRQRAKYQEWLRRFGEPDEAMLSDIRRQIDGLSRLPLISVVLPVYNVSETLLRECIESVERQLYPNWELCIADDASTAAHIRPVLDEFAARDKRIKIVFRSENGHISAASNSALALAAGEFVVLLDHDDAVTEDALFWVANEIVRYPDAGIVYSDEDLIDERGGRFGPKFKPDFSRDLLYSLNFTTNLSAFRTELLRKIGCFRIGFEGSQDYDLVLRVLEQIDEEQIRHIPRVLYHWRVVRGSVAYSMDEKPYAHERARDAIREHFARTGRSAEVSEALHLHRVTYRLPDPRPRVSVIVSRAEPEFDAGLPADIESIQLPPRESRAAQLNEAVVRTSSDVLVFLDGDLRLRHSEQLDELVAFALQPEIGAVSGRILGGDMFVEEAGLVLREDLSVAPAYHDFPNDAPGNMSRNIQIGNYSAISASCMTINRAAFDAVGGFDESTGDMFDVDLCLRLRELKKRIVVVPDVEFVRHGPARERRRASARFRERWSRYAELDPFCNVNLKRDGSFEIEV